MTSKRITTEVIDPHSYGIVVRRIKSGEDYIYKGTVTELPDVVAFEDSYSAAYELAVDAIESLYEAANEDARPFPLPYVQNAEQDFSGRVTLRMPKWLHSHLWNQANLEGVSLNLYMISVLSAASFIRTLVAQTVERIAEISATRNVYYGSIQGMITAHGCAVINASATNMGLTRIPIDTQQSSYLTIFS
ncbi:toxin-antitoxin system HicB family antitoxin [Candidatus Nitrotoga sp. 1052]|uniref:toxin-antitoxin system HicB family antitoxin n=1 Tax=Candidatus Nitrotoga sp. 1052 TaxID=2886964 RepID=UPI001EF61F2C|nr:toxin-antitoxin system HicB family antitoxin [Candidatus Nitrotoga sp. 1052]CAH1090712.1 hypothetical protein NTG1052_80050 [Candidatus Nitrotoga sp. 1052]